MAACTAAMPMNIAGHLLFMKPKGLSFGLAGGGTEGAAPSRWA